MANFFIEKPRLVHVEISGLFGRYEHKFDLAIDERVTILHGPNGIGKTATLRLLYAVFAGRTFQILATRFSSLTLLFQTGEIFQISKMRIEGNNLGERLNLRTIDSIGNQDVIEAHLDQKTLTKFASSVARRVRWLERIGEDMWIDRRSSEYLKTEDLLLRFDDSDPDWQPAQIGISEQVRPLLRMQNMLQQLSRNIDSHIIETQRLLSKQKTSERPQYRIDRQDGDADVRTTVSECAEELKNLIAVNLSHYATESQRRDQSFPFRLLRISGTDHIDRTELRHKLIEIADKRKQLAEVGLLIEKAEPYAERLERLNLVAADGQQLRVIELYAEDTSGKLAILDELLQNSHLFLAIINGRFRHKKLSLDREFGLVATSDNSESIPLDALSSGEQHQLVLYFDLLFKVKPRSIVLIDEPELSLHVTWQKGMLDSLIEIAREKTLDILVATHSPYIVGTKVHLLRDLSAAEYVNDIGI